MAMSREDVSDDEMENTILSFFSSESDLSSVSSDFDIQAAVDRVESYIPKAPDDQTKTVLKSFLQYLPETGRHVIADFVVFLDDNRLHCLYQHLRTAILIPMKARSPTPQITQSPFEDYDKQVEVTAGSMEETPTRAVQQVLKRKCLRRDAFRCLVTGEPDMEAVDSGLVSLDSLSEPCRTELAHIIPFAVGHWGDKDKDFKVSQIWITLRKCFPHIGLGPQDINDLSNLMALETDIHQEFSHFTIAFEATNANPHEYCILVLKRTIVVRYLPQPDVHGIRKVRFQEHPDFPAPSPRLLEVHCALAKILHASGTAENIDKIIRDREKLKCLASDGSSDARTLLFAF